MIKSRADELPAAPSPEYLLVAAALAQILYEGQVHRIDVDLPAIGVRGRIEITQDAAGSPDVRVHIQ